MVHRYQKCSDISEVTSGARAEIENVENEKGFRFVISPPPTDATCEVHLYRSTFHISGHVG